MDSASSKSLLESLQSPSDLKKLPEDQLPRLAAEIRRFLIEVLSETGGHLAPNLGVVELTIALHRIFTTPRDKILFDVSHQSYIHKLLTGRAGRFRTLRQFGGLSGFSKRAESEHDAYGAGHAGTALSAGLGMAAARDLAGDDYDVVAVVGDGSFGCGTTLEGLNNISTTTKKFILILNDNEWSIDKNVGALSRYFSKLQETETYEWLRRRTRQVIETIAGKRAREQASRLVHAVRGLISPLSFFQELGLTYYGPIDGHNIKRLEAVLRAARSRKEPAIIHIITEKGRGYAPARSDPAKFHGIGRYNIANGATAAGGLTYSQAFGQTLAQLAKEDPRITAITAAMPSGTGLSIFREHYPRRFYDVGIAEEHALLFACGQACMGQRPFVAVYSTFMQRAVDMIQHDAALQRLPVRLCMDRAGLSPDDGPTHHGLFDIAMLRCIPDLVMMQPKDEAELACMLRTMQQTDDVPSAIRYPRGSGEGVPMPEHPEALPIGKAELLQRGEDGGVCLVALGNMNSVALAVRSLLAANGMAATCINARFIKPIDADMLCAEAARHRLVVTLEDHVVDGGFGSAVLELLSERDCRTPLLRVGWPGRFIEHGSLEKLREKYGLTPQAIAERIIAKLESLR